jgi:putative transposase
MPSSTFADRVLVSLIKRRHLSQLALRAVLKANQLLGLTFGLQLAEKRDSGEPWQVAFAQCKEHDFLGLAFQEAADILGLRWDKVPDKRRPQYSPELRYRILRFKALLALSPEETARLFRLAPGTIARWERQPAGAADSQAEGSLVKPQPPVRRYADVLRQLIHTMRLVGFGGNLRIAQTLARCGWKVSKRTVARVLKEKSPRTPRSPSARKAMRALRARRPNHILLADLTDIPGLFRLFQFKLAIILDAFSRFPLAHRLFLSDPSARSMAALLRRAVSAHGLARHFVSDRGTQFTANHFRGPLRRLGIRQRFSAVGTTGATALVERLWRSVKALLRLGRIPPFHRQDVEQRLRLVLLYYAYLRPHQGLGGATPAEVYFGTRPAHLSALPPPRGRPGEGSSEEFPFRIRFLDPEERLPLLLPKAA